MKQLTFLCVAAAVFLCGTVVFAETSADSSEGSFAGSSKPLFSWSLLWSGSWEENKTLHNRGEIKLNFLSPGLTLRGEILDRRPFNFELDPPWGDHSRHITNFLGGLYHQPTGSRLLYGVLDEWGLSARVRNPWIRSPPYTENHKPLMADLKTAASSTKEDELYLYLSTPFINITPDVKIRGFASAQTELEKLISSDYAMSAFAGGADFSLPNKTNLLLEVFYTAAKLPPKKSSTWFSSPPPLPERDFNLFAAGILFYNQTFSVSSDFAVSETFAWGTDIYVNFGFSLTPALRKTGSRRVTRPLTISLAADGGGERVIYRDGSGHGAGFRGAAKIEWKSSYNSLFRVNTVLRGPGFGEKFNRSSTGIYYRFPSKSAGNSQNKKEFPVRFTRISLSMDKNAENSQKISEKISGNIGLSLNFQKIGIKTPFGLNISGSLSSLSAVEGVPSPYPSFSEPWNFDNFGIKCEFSWFPSIFQFRSGFGYSKNAKNVENWDFFFYISARFKYGRLSIKAAAPDLNEKWNCTVSWRLEIK